MRKIKDIVLCLSLLAMPALAGGTESVELGILPSSPVRRSGENQIAAHKRQCKKKDPQNPKRCLDARYKPFLSRRGRTFFARFGKRGARLKKTLARNQGDSFYDGAAFGRKDFGSVSEGEGFKKVHSRVAYHYKKTSAQGEKRLFVPTPRVSRETSEINRWLESNFGESLSQLKSRLFVASRSVTAYARGISRNIHETIDYYAKRYSIDANLVLSMVQQESGGNPYAVSKAGAMGLGQLMPATARRFGVMDPFNASQNILGMVRYLRFLKEKFNGDKALMVAAYNSGEGRRAYQYGLIPHFDETIQYLNRVFNNYFNLTGQQVEFYDRIAPTRA